MEQANKGCIRPIFGLVAFGVGFYFGVGVFNSKSLAEGAIYAVIGVIATAVSVVMFADAVKR